MRDGLAAEKSAFVEQPFVYAVELLEGVVRQHRRVRASCDLKDERITSTDRAGRRRDDAVRRYELVEPTPFLRGDAMAEGRVDHHDHVVVLVLGDKGVDCLFELGQARHLTTFGRDVGSVDDEMSWCLLHERQSISSRRLNEGGAGRSTRWSVRAVLFDMGGVLVASPFTGFARYERAAGLEPGSCPRWSRRLVSEFGDQSPPNARSRISACSCAWMVDIPTAGLPEA